jgi:hypothetical protein
VQQEGEAIHHLILGCSVKETGLHKNQDCFLFQNLKTTSTKSIRLVLLQVATTCKGFKT